MTQRSIVAVSAGLGQPSATRLLADRLVAATERSYSGLYKLFFDVLERDGLAGKPVLIGATGGTPRHSLALDHAIRPMFAYLNALVMPTPVFAASDDWGQDAAPEDGSLIDRIERAGREFAGAIASGGRTPPADPFADPVPFDQLLRSSSS